MDFSTTAKSNLFLAVVLIAITVSAWLPQLDNLAMQQIDAGLKRALVTFGVAKSLDAAISVAQSAQLSLHLGLGVALTVGEVLDPINDLIEQFSSCILVAAVAFGMQKILVTMGAYALVKVALSLITGSWLVYCLKKQQPPKLLVFAFCLIVLVRFALPLITIASNFLFENFLASEYQSSETVMQNAAAEFNDLNPDQFAAPPPVEAEQGLWDRLKPNVPIIPTAADLKGIVDKFKQQADFVSDKVVGNMVNLVVVFLLQTLVFPIVILWLLFKLATGLFSAMVR